MSTTKQTQTSPPQAALYAPGKLSAPDRIITRAAAYELVKNSYKKETLQIQQTFANELQNGFAAGTKRGYQEAKKNTLSSFTFTYLTRDKDGAHQQIISLDIDTDTPEILRAARQKMENCPYCEAAALSVSGVYTGAFWANILIEVPEFKHLPEPAKRAIQQATGVTLNPDNCQGEIHKLYHTVLKWVFKQQIGVTIGESKDLKRARYIAHDPDIYINQTPQVYTLQNMVAILPQLGKAQQAAQQTEFDRAAANISATDFVTIATDFAKNGGNGKEGKRKKGYQPEHGTRHLFATHFAIACNLLGIEQKTAEAAFLTTFATQYTDSRVIAGGKIAGDTFAYPYKKYKANFGQWAYRLQDNGTGQMSTLPFFPVELTRAAKTGEKIKTIVFTDGEIKAATAAKKGVFAVSFAGIGVYKICQQIEQLLEVCKPENIVINYDADSTDQTRSNQRKASFFNSAYRFTRQLIDYQTETKNSFNIFLNFATGKAGKGLDDNFINEPATVAQFNTLETGNYFVFEKINKYNFVSLYERTFGGWRDHRHTDGIVLTGKPGEKLGTILERYGMSMAGKAMAVPTGGGKTFAGNKFADAGNKIVFAVPTLSLANNIAGEYGMTIFTGAQKEDIKGAEKIVTTFSSLASVCKIINPEFYHLFIDEAHNTGAGFMYSTMQKVVAHIERFKSITTLTGTPAPEFIPQLAALPRVTVTMPQPKKRFYRYNAKDTLKAASVAVQTSIAKGRFPVVLLNDTNEGGKLGAMEVLLQAAGIKYATFNSYKKQDADFLSITKNGIIPGNIQAIITTTVLKEGNNIYNNLPFDYIIMGNFHVNEIHQLSERSRNSTDTAVYWLRGEKTEQSTSKINAYKLASYFTDAANNAIQELNLQAKDEPEAVILAEAQARGAIGALPIKRNDLGQYELDPVRLNSMVFDAERNALCRNEAWYFKRLQAFGFTIETGTATDGAPPPPAKIVAERTQAETEAIKEQTESAKKVEENQIKQVLPQLLEYGAARIEAILQDRRNELSKTEQILYRHFSKLCRFCTEAKAVEHLGNIGLSKSKFKALYNRMVHQFLLNNESYNTNAGSLSIAVMAIYKKLELGKVYTPEALQAALLDCLNLDSGLNTYKYKHEAQKQRHCQTIKTLRYFFEVEDTKQKPTAYKLSEINKDNLFGVIEQGLNEQPPKWYSIYEIKEMTGQDCKQCQNKIRRYIAKKQKGAESLKKEHIKKSKNENGSFMIYYSPGLVWDIFKVPQRTKQMQIAITEQVFEPAPF